LPWWIETLDAAERWGIPPWELEEHAPDIWMERQLLWTAARNNRASDRRPEVGTVTKQGNVQKKRLI
jgi:hypothetical protein